ncbi:MAG: NYN domain-containing protein [Candidatus Omnitrophota bacterium]
MPIIIDGWNFIRHESAELDYDDALDGARILISHLQRFQKTHSDPVVLVFDSRNEFLGVPYQNSAKLTIVAARDADSYIKKYIDKYPPKQRRSLRVVSSDRSIYFYAKDSRASPVKCEEFWEKL